MTDESLPTRPEPSQGYRYGHLSGRDGLMDLSSAAWLIGHFLDAWVKVYGAFETGGIGTISEIFDAETPYSGFAVALVCFSG
jgi:hypothetical protein